MASTSTRRLLPPTPLWMTTRTFVVVTSAKVTLRQTRLLLVMTPPGTVAHAEPSQYCTMSKSARVSAESESV